MNNWSYEFLIPERQIDFKEDVIDYCDQKGFKYYWQLKFLFRNKDQKLESKNKNSYKPYHYINSLIEREFEHKKKNKNQDKNEILNLKRNIVEMSIPYTIAIWTEIKLKAPYFSRDDEEYYYIANPILKDKATKTPMVRGSGIKGKLEVCAAKVMYESILKDGNNLISELTKYLRIFGSGNDELKSLNALLQRLLDEKNSAHLTDETKKEIATQFIRFILLNFGGEVAKRTVDNILGSENVDAVNKIVDWIHKNMKEKEALKSQKGRLTFFPMFFNKIKLEVINRHSRARRVGEGPIYFEVVPKDDEANLILVYTPFDAVYKTKAEIKKEAEEDLEFIIKALEKLQGEGLGAKRKYGWGQFEMKEKMIIKRDQDELKTYEGWNVE